ncbi:universal stress protein [Alicyclobacillus curvatus]|jgi:nucleotide-binding universal stress UspA family protein|nr:universal stress protein [Alicyclobacillus curvatus]
MNQILFATDASVSAERAKDMVRHLLKSWPQAKLTVLYVTRSLNAYEPASDESLDAERATFKGVQELAEGEWFSDFAGRVQCKHVYGEPAMVISLEAKEHGADLIVLGGRAVGQPDPLLTGSVSHGVLYISQVPVLVVKGDTAPEFAAV